MFEALRVGAGAAAADRVGRKAGEPGEQGSGDRGVGDADRAENDHLAILGEVETQGPTFMSLVSGLTLGVVSRLEEAVLPTFLVAQACLKDRLRHARHVRNAATPSQRRWPYAATRTAAGCELPGTIGGRGRRRTRPGAFIAADALVQEIPVTRRLFTAALVLLRPTGALAWIAGHAV